MAKGSKHRPHKDWTLENVTEFFDKAEALSRDGTCDYMNEILFELDSDQGTLRYLLDKFKQFDGQFTRIKMNCEVICHKNLKRGKIPVAVGIFNLKVNHDWRQPLEIADDGAKPPIKVEGVANEDLQKMLKSGE